MTQTILSFLWCDALFSEVDCSLSLLQRTKQCNALDIAARLVHCSLTKESMANVRTYRQLTPERNYHRNIFVRFTLREK